MAQLKLPLNNFGLLAIKLKTLTNYGRDTKKHKLPEAGQPHELANCYQQQITNKYQGKITKPLAL